MTVEFSPAEIDPKWRARWAEQDLYRTPEPSDRPTFYCLDFFPYPSGDGISVGHLRNYVPTDVLSRVMRMRGYDVLHPMGWDAFGLPTENAAIETGRHPADLTREWSANYKRQLDLAGASFDWAREINSTHPEYYRWTEWFFLPPVPAPAWPTGATALAVNWSPDAPDAFSPTKQVIDDGTD